MLLSIRRSIKYWSDSINKIWKRFNHFEKSKKFFLSFWNDARRFLISFFLKEFFLSFWEFFYHFDFFIITKVFSNHSNWSLSQEFFFIIVFHRIHHFERFCYYLKTFFDHFKKKNCAFLFISSETKCGSSARLVFTIDKWHMMCVSCATLRKCI